MVSKNSTTCIGELYICSLIPYDHRANFIFKLRTRSNNEEKLYFAMMIVVMKKELINDPYKDVCKHLGVDAQFPLILTTGVIKPRDQPINEDAQRFKRWVYHTVLSKAGGGNFSENDIRFNIKDGSSYALEKPMTLNKLRDSDDPSCWCEDAAFKIRYLINIKNSEVVQEIVDELLNM